MSEHIVPVRVYITIFLVLLVGTALTVAAAFVDFPWRSQHDRRPDYRHHQSDVRRALLHARALQFTTDLGDFGGRVVLDGNTVRVHVQRLPDARLDLDSTLAGTLLARLQCRFPHLDQALTRRAVQTDGGV